MAAEVKEEFVIFELAGLPNADLIKDKSCYLLGIEEEKPIIQVGSFVFQGEYEDILGTGLMLEKLPDRSMQLVCKSSKKVQMTRISIRQNNNTSQEPNSDNQSPS